MLEVTVVYLLLRGLICVHKSRLELPVGFHPDSYCDVRLPPHHAASLPGDFLSEFTELVRQNLDTE